MSSSKSGLLLLKTRANRTGPPGPIRLGPRLCGPQGPRRPGGWQGEREPEENEAEAAGEARADDTADVSDSEVVLLTEEQKIEIEIDKVSRGETC